MTDWRRVTSVVSAALKDMNLGGREDCPALDPAVRDLFAALTSARGIFHRSGRKDSGILCGAVFLEASDERG